jgi:large repetitive protein
MSMGRSWDTVTLLTNGHVLIAGEQGLEGDTATAEIYDPATGLFSPTGSMTVARGSHTATLLKDGRVLIAGSGPDGKSAELYWP